jgi:hypothetical protein
MRFDSISVKKNEKRVVLPVLRFRVFCGEHIYTRKNRRFVCAHSENRILHDLIGVMINRARTWQMFYLS